MKAIEFIFALLAVECAEGYYLNGTDCLACPLDEYKDTVGNLVSCTQCPDGTKTLATGAVNSSLCGEYCIL